MISKFGPEPHGEKKSNRFDVGPPGFKGPSQLLEEGDEA